MALDELTRAEAKKAEKRAEPATVWGMLREHAEARRLAGLGGFVLLLSACFFGPLRGWVQLGFESSFSSYVVMIPFISVYLAWLQRKQVLTQLASSWSLAAVTVLIGGLLLVGQRLVAGDIQMESAEDGLWLSLAAYLAFIYGGVFFFLGVRAARILAFPLGFLLFMVPLPSVVKQALEEALQHGSAEAAYWLLSLSGTTMLRDGLYFHFPNLTIHVARECSGIRSSYVLLMASLLAGHLFLRSNWKRGFLTLIVLPIGVVRNGFRILTISLLTIHVDPEIIHGPLHKRGGPLFFALSLIPLFLALFLLRWSERRRAGASTNIPQPRAEA